MADLEPGTIRLGEGHEFIISVHEASAATGEPQAATDLIITAFLADAEDAAESAALTDTVVTPLVARTDARFGDEYAARISATVTDPGLSGKTEVYERFVGTNLNRSRKLLIVGPAAA